MTGNEQMGLAVACVWGAALGAMYFSVLWLSLRMLSTSRRPRTVFAAAYVVRLAIALAGFWAALAFGYLALAAAMAGFVGMRMFMVRRIGEITDGGGGADKS